MPGSVPLRALVLLAALGVALPTASDTDSGEGAFNEMTCLEGTNARWLRSEGSTLRVKYLGTFHELEACGDACRRFKGWLGEECHSVVWHGLEVRDCFSKGSCKNGQCFARTDKRWSPTKANNVWSCARNELLAGLDQARAKNSSAPGAANTTTHTTAHTLSENHTAATDARPAASATPAPAPVRILEGVLDALGGGAKLEGTASANRSAPAPEPAAAAPSPQAAARAEEPGRLQGIFRKLQGVRDAEASRPKANSPAAAVGGGEEDVGFFRDMYGRVAAKKECGERELARGQAESARRARAAEDADRRARTELEQRVRAEVEREVGEQRATARQHHNHLIFVLSLAIIFLVPFVLSELRQKPAAREEQEEAVSALAPAEEPARRSKRTSKAKVEAPAHTHSKALVKNMQQQHRAADELSEADTPPRSALCDESPKAGSPPYSPIKRLDLQQTQAHKLSSTERDILRLREEIALLRAEMRSKRLVPASAASSMDAIASPPRSHRNAHRGSAYDTPPRMLDVGACLTPRSGDGDGESPPQTNEAHGEAFGEASSGVTDVSDVDSLDITIVSDRRASARRLGRDDAVAFRQEYFSVSKRHAVERRYKESAALAALFHAEAAALREVLRRGEAAASETSDSTPYATPENSCMGSGSPVHQLGSPILRVGGGAPQGGGKGKSVRTSDVLGGKRGSAQVPCLTASDIVWE